MIFFQLLIKRALDLCFSTLGLLITAPLFIIIAVLVKLTSSGAVLYRQTRVGKNKKFFRIFKFRTMSEGSETQKNGLAVVEGDSRITKFGYFLRKTSLDELPQLINVFFGDLSIVGPRPALPEQLHYYNTSQMDRLKMRPGITGLATVSGRCSIPWSRRIELDLEYIEKFSLLLDIIIILKTFRVVLSGKDTYFDNSKGPAFDLSDPDDLPQSGVIKDKRN